jgi:hypothetical protein
MRALPWVAISMQQSEMTRIASVVTLLCVPRSGVLVPSERDARVSSQWTRRIRPVAVRAVRASVGARAPGPAAGAGGPGWSPRGARAPRPFWPGWGRLGARGQVGRGGPAYPLSLAHAVCLVNSLL